MKFSLVMTTLGRSDEIKSFLESLKSQTYINYELIIVDQNTDDRVLGLIESTSCESFKKKIKYLKMSGKGISKGRNLGLNHISGGIVGFPDDDCEYPIGLLENVRNIFQKNPQLSILTGKCIDKRTLKRSSQRSPRSRRSINSFNIFTTVASTALFIKTEKIHNLCFDEDFGINSRFGAAEDSDFIYRLLKSNHRGIYNPEIVVYHPDKEVKREDIITHNFIENMFIFNKGCGAFFRKNLSRNFDILLLLNSISTIFVKPFVGFLINLFNYNQRMVFKAKLRGRLMGFLEFSSKSK